MLLPTSSLSPIISRLRLTVTALAISLVILFSGSAITAQSERVDPRREVKRAVKLTRAGNLDESEAALRALLAAYPDLAEAKVELAYCLVKQRRLNEAYDLAFAVAGSDPRNARALSVLGAVLLSAGRFNEARQVFFRAVDLDGNQHLAWAGYGMLEFYENRVDQSLIDLREAVYLKPDEPDYLFAFAQVASRAEKYREAADAYNRFLTVSSVTDVDRRDRIKGLITFLRFLGEREVLYSIAGKDQTLIPFELVGDRPVVEMRVNGRPEPLRFVLDTGSGISVISKKTADVLKVREVTRGGHAKGIGGNGKFEIVYGFLRQVEIGDVSIRNVPVYIREFHRAGSDVDGYIGLALISKFLTTIDYGDRTFSLSRRNEAGPSAAANVLSLPLRLTSSGFLSGEVKLDGIDTQLNFIVDTGASISVISDRVANVDMIRKFENDERHRVIGSAGITDDVPSFLLPRVSFGAISRTSIMAIALNLDMINEASGFEQAGILGGNFLKNYRLTFDFKNSRVSFTSVTPEN